MPLANGDDDKDRLFTAAVFKNRNISIIIIGEVVTALCSLTHLHFMVNVRKAVNSAELLWHLQT